jgi:hypothetical protein
MTEAPLWQVSAVKAVQLLESGEITPLQLVEAAEQRWRVRRDTTDCVTVPVSSPSRC